LHNSGNYAIIEERSSGGDADRLEGPVGRLFHFFSGGKSLSAIPAMKSQKKGLTSLLNLLIFLHDLFIKRNNAAELDL
jgi:hypothetical protein